MIIDCDSCAVRGEGCGDCVVSVLLGAPPAVQLDAEQQRAIDVLAGAGMVPKLRLVPIAVDHETNDTPGHRYCAERSSDSAERRQRRAS
ncbi:MAG: hypothetical protein ACRDRN_02930 [Sciscionella sp.]